MNFLPQDSDWESKVRGSFARQGIMDTLGARLTDLQPGRAEITVPFHPGLSQQHGYFHAGVTSTIADSAGGYAGFTLMPADTTVVTVEFKINLMAPAHGELLRAVGTVLRPGRSITTCEAEVYVAREGAEKLCAKMQQTLICLTGRPEQGAG